MGVCTELQGCLYCSKCVPLEKGKHHIRYSEYTLTATLITQAHREEGPLIFPFFPHLARREERASQAKPF